MKATLRRRLERAMRVRDSLRAHKTEGVAEAAGLARLEELVTRAEALVTMARGMLEHATAQKALLVSRGMSETLLDEVAGAIAELEKTLEATRTGRRDHVGASADLEAIPAEIGEQVQLLDGLVRYRFGDNAELMGAWASARNVTGPFKSHAEATPAGGETPEVVKPAACTSPPSPLSANAERGNDEMNRGALGGGCLPRLVVTEFLQHTLDADAQCNDRPRRIGPASAHFGGSLLPERIAKIFTSDEVASRQSAAVRKSAVRLCCSSTASFKEALACLRMFSLAPPAAVLPRNASIIRPASVSLGMTPSDVLWIDGS